MTIRITEDEDEPGGYAFIDLGGPLQSPLLSFRRQDTEPRHLGAEGWQPEVAWLTPLAVTERDGRAFARFGPNVVDRIEEHPANSIYNAGVSMSINTDARTISDTTLEKEYSFTTVAVWDPRMWKDYPKLYSHRAPAAAL